MSRLRTETIGDATLILGDCREVLDALQPFDALVTDPPYGIGESNKKNLTRGTSTTRVRRKTIIDYGDYIWDDQPIDDALLRQVRASARWNIIFGGNYYPSPATTCWLVWDKLNTGDFADCELAWTNLPKAVRRLRYLWNGCMRANGETRGDHPTQKPIGVMKWALQQLPPLAKSILDPFMGSGTTGVACMELGLRFTGIEREERYFDAACRRIETAWKAPRLFTVNEPTPLAGDLFALGSPDEVAP